MISGVDACERLLAQHLNEAVQRFGAPALDVVDLPPLSGGAIEPGQLRAAAVLVWARELEQAGLLPFVEKLAAGVHDGRLLLPLGEAADRLMRYLRGHKQRLSADERQAEYQRVLGDPHDPQSPSALLEHVVDALDEVGRTPGADPLPYLSTRVAVSAREAAAALSARSAGMAAWAARDIVAHVRQALALLQDRELAAALGGGALWTRIALHSPDVLGRQVDPTAHVARAQAGLRLVEWLADQARALESLSLRVRAADPVVRDAETWRANA